MEAGKYMSYAVAFNILSFGERRKMKNLVLQQRSPIILDFFIIMKIFVKYSSRFVLLEQIFVILLKTSRKNCELVAQIYRASLLGLCRAERSEFES